MLKKTLMLLLCVAPCWINLGCWQPELRDLRRDDITTSQDNVILQLCCELLGIELINLSDQEIKKEGKEKIKEKIDKALRKRASKHHPDKTRKNVLAEMAASNQEATTTIIPKERMEEMAASNQEATTTIIPEERMKEMAARNKETTQAITRARDILKAYVDNGTTPTEPNHDEDLLRQGLKDIIR